MNCIVLTGNLTAAPQHKVTKTGKPQANFTIAVRREFARDGQQNTDFIPCICWGRTADYVMNYADKGSRATVRGSLQINMVMNGEEKRYLSQVVVDKVELGMKRQESTAPLAEPAGEDFTEVVDDGLPF